MELQTPELQSHPVQQVNKKGNFALNIFKDFQHLHWWIFRESDGEADDLQRTAQYLTRNVILYTHYAGEVSNIVDEHFTKALNQSNFNENKGKQSH